MSWVLDLSILLSIFVCIYVRLIISGYLFFRIYFNVWCITCYPKWEEALDNMCDVLKDVVSRDIVQPLASVQRPEQKYWLPHPVPLFTAVSMIPNMCHWSGIRAWHNTRHFSRTILSCLFFTRSSRFFTHIGFLLQTCIRLRLCLERVLICSLFTAIVGRGGC